MKHTLTWWDLIWWFAIGAVIFVLTDQEAAGPAVVVSYAVSGVLAVFCYSCTEFAVDRSPSQVRRWSLICVSFLRVVEVAVGAVEC